MAISVSPTRGVTRVPSSVKPDSMQSPTIAPTAEPVKPVPNPLELNPNKQPDPKAAAEYYAYEKNEKARRRREKQNR